MTPSGRGQEAQACSLSVDVVQRQRHAAIFFFAKWRPAPAAMELEDGPRAAGASGRDRGGDLRGRGSIAGPLRTAVGAQACSLSVDLVQRQRHPAIFFFTKLRPPPAAMEVREGTRPAATTTPDPGAGL